MTDFGSCPLCDSIRKLPGENLVWQFAHSVAFLAPWQYYHGYCVLVSNVHVRELHELPDEARRGYLDELNLLSRAIMKAVRPHKLNVELLGNLVPHPHWHIIPRYESDPEKLKPAWLAMDRAERDAAERQRLVTGPIPRAETLAVVRAAVQELLP